MSDAALALIARSAEGSMRDAQSAFDQVIAFAGKTIAADDVSTVLGLIGRDLLFDIVEAVLDEDGPRAFALADRAVESGHDLRLVCRELSGLVRDLMIVSVDPARANEGDIAETERTRIAELAKRFSREDLMRAFDVLAKAEQDIRNASQPRYHLEMALLRWMHLRKLVPLTELLDQMGRGSRVRQPAPRARRRHPPGVRRRRLASPRPAPAASKPPAAPTARPVTPRAVASGGEAGADGYAVAGGRRVQGCAPRGDPHRARFSLQHRRRPGAEDRSDRRPGDVYVSSGASCVARATGSAATVARGGGGAPGRTKGRRRGGAGTGRRSWCACVAGRGIRTGASRAGAGVDAGGGKDNPDAKREAMASPVVRDLLDVFPAEIRNVEEM